MVKETISYVDYDGTERCEDFYFNLTQAEVVEMEMGTTGGMRKMLENIVRAKDSKRIIEIFKEIIAKAYGVKSADGRQFIKNQEVLDAFTQTEAYSKLFMKLAFDHEAAAKFINAVVPQDMAEAAKAAEAVDVPATSPVFLPAT